jgi:hypothetical protein
LELKKISFTIRATASRLEKGLLAIPRRLVDYFPKDRGQIQIVFDDSQRAETKTYSYDEKMKERRVYGLSRWFSERQVKPNDSITITIEDQIEKVYRVALDRYVRARQESKAREKLHLAPTEELANAELDTLAQIVRRGRRKTALEEILRVSADAAWEPRKRLTISSADRHEGVPAGLRLLLREVHQGKCQICSFTFSKRDGNPYFELHHIDPQLGHQPMNLLLLCPNCHAQFENANITDLQRVKGWLVSVSINGKRFTIRQPTIQSSESVTTSYGIAILLLLQTALLAASRLANS